MTSNLNTLIITTAHSTLGSSGTATGLWLEEFTTPYYIFTQAGARITVATLPGGEVPLDPGSINVEGKNPISVDRFFKDEHAQAILKTSKPLSSLSAKGWDIVYIPGGHGAMWDLASSQELAEFLTTAWANKSIIGSVCHGPACLINVKDETGKALVFGRHVNAFSDSEECAINLTSIVPFPLENKLRELGALYEKGTDFTAFAVQDGRLVTGQNPMSSEKVAQMILKAASEFLGA